MTMPANHECLHEEQIYGQSRKLAELEAKNESKKERITEIKSELKDMDKKIDNIDNNVNKLILHSETNDAQLETRLESIETRLDLYESFMKESKEDTNKRTTQQIAIIALLISGIGIILNAVTHFI